MSWSVSECAKCLWDWLWDFVQYQYVDIHDSSRISYSWKLCTFCNKCKPIYVHSHLSPMLFVNCHNFCKTDSTYNLTINIDSLICTYDMLSHWRYFWLKNIVCLVLWTAFIMLLNLHALSCAAHFVEKKTPRILVPLFIFFLWLFRRKW